MRKILSILTISILFITMTTNGLQIKESNEEPSDVLGCVRVADYMAVTLATLGGLGAEGEDALFQYFFDVCMEQN